ncbi:hypothetical protein MMC07_004349 [Pseudocyphellaria aurata]|nr:hypothetical protein [Pseudocyphellaria aurata]
MEEFNFNNHFDRNDGASRSMSALRPSQTTATSKSGKGPRIIWTAEMTEALLETLKAQLDLGKRSDKGWKPEAWNAAQVSVARASPRGTVPPSTAQVKSKLDNIKLLFKEWKALAKQSEFCWNEQTELYEAGDYVWENYLKVIALHQIDIPHTNNSQTHKYARWHQNNPLHNRDLLHHLFLDSLATDDGDVSMVGPVTNESGAMDPALYDAVLNSHRQQRKPSKRKSGTSDHHDNNGTATSAMRAVSMVDGIAALMTEELSKRRKTRQPDQPQSTKQEMAIALLYSDYETRLGTEGFVEAINLIENESKAMIFTSLRAGDKRDRWLERQIGTEIWPLDVVV